MAWSNGTAISVPMTAAVWRRRFSSGGRRSIRAASTAWIVSGMPSTAGEVLGSIATQVSSSRKKGLPAAWVTMACSRGSGSNVAGAPTVPQPDCPLEATGGRANWVATECPNQGGRYPAGG